jgi:cyclopropane fatty-acyl-phospholipid synthase-like methyltransferase
MKSKNELISQKVKSFYEQNPYPGLNDNLMMDSAKRLSPYFNKPGKILFPGCGTGHGIVALAKLRPDLKCYGLDLSNPSLEIARKLAKKYKVDITLEQGNYMEPLPWDEKFQFITLQGTLHHTAEPSLALSNLLNYLDNDGYVHIHLYGKKYHRRRFEIIELLDILQDKNSSDLHERFELFQAMQSRLKEKNLKGYIMDFSLRYVWHTALHSYRRIKTSITKSTSSVPWHYDFKECDQLWIDQYSNPNELTYDILDTKELLESVNLEVVEMLSLGKIMKSKMPSNSKWHSLFNELSEWDKYRVMELFHPKALSVNLIAKMK